MKLLSSLRSISSMLFHRSRLERDMENELRAHIQNRADDLVHAGLSRADAERRARIEFGGYQKYKEEIRESLGAHFLETLAQDIRYALRMLRKSPGFTTVAVLTLALGIGANTAAFSMVNALIFHPYNFHGLDRLVRVWEDRGVDDGPDARFISPADADYLRANANVFSGVATLRFQSFALGSQGSLQNVLGCAVSREFFTVLEVSPMLGRAFTPQEEQRGGQVVIVSYRFWQRQLGGQAAIGSSIQLDGRAYTIVGIAPKDFDYPVPVKLWIPLALTPPERADRSRLSLESLARLNPGVSVGQARAALDTAARRLAQEYPSTNLGRRVATLQLRRELYLYTLPLFLLLQAAAVFVILLACTNLANLLFARMLGRTREVALRVALGADRRRLACLFITESLLFSFFGGGVAIAASFWGVKLLRTSISSSWTEWVPGWPGIQVNGSVLAFAIGLAVVVGILFGVAAVFHSGRGDLSRTLKENAGSMTLAKAKLRSAMVVAQVTLALVLLVCAGLTIQGFMRLAGIYGGLKPANLLRAEIVLPKRTYAADASMRNFYQQLLQRASALPGLASVALISNTPASNVDNPVSEFTIQGRAATRKQTPSAALQIASPAYFATLRIPLFSGRYLSSADSEASERVVLISRSMAQRFFPSGALGQQIKLGAADSASPWLTVVGIVGDIRQNWWNPPESPTIYEPLQQSPRREMCLLLRATNPASYVSAVRSAVSAIDTGVVPASIKTLQSEVDDSIAIIRILGILMAIFGAFALALAALGVYGVFSERVAQRTHEFGIRMALGASPRGTMNLVLAQAIRLTAIGIAVGVPAAMAVALLMNNLIYGVVALNYAILASFAVLLAVVAALAAYVPARRAMKVDPMVALRYE